MIDFHATEEARRLMVWDERLADELRIVAMLSVDRSLADLYYAETHLHQPSWWLNPAYYHMFMLLLTLEFHQEEKDFWKRIKTKGKELIAEEKRKS